MLKSINKALDMLESRWALAAFISGFIGMTSVGSYLASVTEWMSAWGPFGWLAAGVTSAFLSTMCLLAFGKFTELRSRRSLNIKRAEKSSNINILDDSFESRVINVNDLWSHQHPKIQNKRFHKCRFVGPMVIAFLDQVTANGLHLSDCNLIEIGSSRLTGVIGFTGCIFTECEFDCVTLLVHEDTVESMKKGFNSQIEFVARPKGP